MELTGDEVAKDGVDVGAGIIVSFRPDLLAGRMIISVLGMIKGQIHELHKRNLSPAMNAI